MVNIKLLLLRPLLLEGECRRECRRLLRSKVCPVLLPREPLLVPQQVMLASAHVRKSTHQDKVEHSTKFRKHLIFFPRTRNLDSETLSPCRPLSGESVLSAAVRDVLGGGGGDIGVGLCDDFNLIKHSTYYELCNYEYMCVKSEESRVKKLKKMNKLYIYLKAVYPPIFGVSYLSYILVGDRRISPHHQQDY